MNVKRFFLLITLFSTLIVTRAQETVIVGQVFSEADKTPIPFANVLFKYTTKGAQCNQEGYFLLRNNGIETTLVISSVGFKKKEIKIKPGQSVGLEVYLAEDNTLLQDVLVIPGMNPALDLIKKVRMMKSLNDVSKHHTFAATGTEQNLVLLSKVNQRNVSKRIFDQLLTGNLSASDSLLVLPLYMAEVKYSMGKSSKKELSKNIFSSPEVGEKFIEHLVGEMEVNLNFYESYITVFGKSMISPLSTIGNSYYTYFLNDSIQTITGKQYKVHFRSKNDKNLAFNGKMWIDSATLAITSIEAELPKQANINFIHNLKINKQFEQLSNKLWYPRNDDMTMNLNYELMADSLHPKPEIFIKRSVLYQVSNKDSLPTNHFAQTTYTQENLNDKLRDLNNTPLLITAKYMVNVALTAYLPIGKISIGKIQDVLKINDIEGLRMTLPFKTNQNLWKNVSIGGSVGYGFKSEIVKYSANGQVRIPSNRRRILGVSYLDDYRRIDYNYNNFLLTENPLLTGDEDISSTVFAFKSARKVAQRKEYQLSFTNDWNNDIESSIYLRANKLFSNAILPMTLNGIEYPSVQQQSITFATRFSSAEKTYEDHLQRIYIANKRPVFYSVMEIGKYTLGATTGTYGKLSGLIKQNVKLNIGQFNYVADIGVIIGKVPYPLLQYPSGCETGGYSLYSYNKMNYMEFGTDRYLNFHSELMLNGLIVNQIPLIKYLNLREIFSFNLAYGSLNEGHRAILDYPRYMNPMTKPYQEFGAGFTNIFRILSIQAVWRLSGLNPGVDGWGLRGYIDVHF